MMNKRNILERIYVAALLVIFGGMVLHAPISVGLSSLWPDYDLLIKSWKEILMIVESFLAIYLIYKNKRTDILKKPLFGLIAAYLSLHIIILLFFKITTLSILAGLIIDLRYLLFFVLVYVALSLYPNYRKLFIKVGVIGAVVVMVFALLQVFVLPRDVLKYIGYGTDTISPYLTVDKNEAFIRINSTMRGPNPLGAYSGIVLAVAAAFIAKHKKIQGKWVVAALSLLLIGGSVALFASYSRSAWIAAAVSVLIVLSITLSRKLSTSMWITVGLITLLSVGGLLALGKNDFVSNIILHDNPGSTSQVDSNDQHSDSLVSGFTQMINQPFGAGIGSTGSASLLGDNPEIIENQYLFIAHESGWLGLIIFTAVYGIIMVELWKKRRDWFALGVFASGIGLALVGLLLPVWADDAVSIIWWGAAAVAIVGYKKVNDIER